MMFNPDNRTLKVAIALTLTALILFSPMSAVFAAQAPGIAGQPNKSCQAVSSTPGHAASARGSAFNTSGIAGTKYAGTQPQNSKNPKSVSQYDVACFQVSTH
jgi:hypothetical protein